MKLAFSANAFRRHTLEETISILADCGYEGLEIMTDTPHAWPPDVDAAKIGSVRAALERHRMGVSNVNAFMMCAVGDFHHPSWIGDDRRLRVDHTIASLRLAAAWGASTVSTQPGGLMQDVTDRTEAETRFAEGLREASRVAEDVGVRLLVEPEPSCLLDRSGPADEFLSGLNLPAVAMNFDLGHFYCVGEDPADVIRRFRGRAAHFHLEDIAADRTHFHLPPGEGAMDFDGVFRALRETGYEGWVTVELYPFLDDAPAVARRARRFLEQWIPQVVRGIG